MEAQSFSTWLRGQLRRREWTQADLARAIDVPSGTVSRWMNGQRPDTDYCDRIADALHVDVDLVLEKAGHRPEVGDDTDLVREFTALLRQVEWTPEREWLIRTQLTGMVDIDRRKRATRSSTSDGVDGAHQ